VPAVADVDGLATWPRKDVPLVAVALSTSDRFGAGGHGNTRGCAKPKVPVFVDVIFVLALHADRLGAGGYPLFRWSLRLLASKQPRYRAVPHVLIVNGTTKRLARRANDSRTAAFGFSETKSQQEAPENGPTHFVQIVVDDFGMFADFTHN
jgi:hypothetical protein